MIWDGWAAGECWGRRASGSVKASKLSVVLSISGRSPDGTRPGGQREVFQEPAEEVSRCAAVESSGRSAAVRALHCVVVQDCQCLQLPRA